MTDRSIPPEIGALEPLDIPGLDSLELPGGMRLHYKNTADCRLIRFDMVVRAGSAFQTRPLVALLTNTLMKEGCKDLSSADIAERFDTYGAFVYYSCSMEYAMITLCTTRKYLRQTLTLLHDLFVAPTFPEKELEIALSQRLQDFLIGLEKVQVQAAQKMNALLFGENHPYGRILQQSDFENFDRNLLLEFHREYYTPARTFLVMTGEVDASAVQIVADIFSTATSNVAAATSDVVKTAYPLPQPSSTKCIFIPKPSSMQAALRFSLPTVGQQHPDFTGLKILNTALGGYFGSRLMKVLREEKGYTYGIYSTHTVYRHLSYIDIETQTAVQYALPLIEGVFEEMRKLREQPIGEEEWHSLMNYISGEYARMMDGPFSLSDLFIAVETLGMPMSFYQKQMKMIEQIRPEDIQSLAQRYLQPDDFFLVRAGGKE